jgi:hypothetical protein
MSYPIIMIFGGLAWTAFCEMVIREGNVELVFMAPGSLAFIAGLMFLGR